jgi:hypothetical protein
MVRESNGPHVYVLSGTEIVDQVLSFAHLIPTQLTVRSDLEPFRCRIETDCRIRTRGAAVARYEDGYDVSCPLVRAVCSHSGNVGAIKQNTRQRKEFIMHQSRGAVSFTPLFTSDDIGLRKDASVEHVVKVFLNVGEATAARWIEMPRGILLLQAVPDRPASGAIYLYDRKRHVFFFVDFVDGRDDTLTATEFDELVTEYDLVSWTANPESLPETVRNIGMA